MSPIPAQMCGRAFVGARPAWAMHDVAADLRWCSRVHGNAEWAARTRFAVFLPICLWNAILESASIMGWTHAPATSKDVVTRHRQEL